MYIIVIIISGQKVTPSKNYKIQTYANNVICSITPQPINVDSVNNTRNYLLYHASATEQFLLSNISVR